MTLTQGAGRSLLGSLVLLLSTTVSVVPAATVSTAATDDALYDEAAAELEEQGQGFPDPLEDLNRGTLALNQGIDRWVLHPITSVYRFIVPDPGRRAVRHVLANLNSPAILVNDLLQLEFHDAGVTTARFLMNSTVGVGGIFDIATAAGLEGHSSDFGETLARVGVSSGPFIVLPVFGPTTLRDGTGSLVDFMFRPTTYMFYGVDQIFYSSIHGGSAGLAQWESQSENLARLEESSIDYYAALRSAYYQNRMAEIRDPRESGGPAAALDR